jgi:type II secretory pathway pseudopilin PulG
LVVLIIAGFIGYGAFKLAHNKTFTSTFGKALSYGTGLGASEKQMASIIQALHQYRTDNGNYPKSLSGLVPKYLPVATVLHSPLDTNPDPTHVSYSYVKPFPSAPATTEVINITYSFDFGQAATPGTGVKQVFAATLGGQLITATLQNGVEGQRTTTQMPPAK